PAWAYIDPRGDNTFNLTHARTMVDYPESTYIGYPTASISIGLSTTILRPVTVTLFASTTPASSTGVVGGVATIALAVAAVFIWKRRHQGDEGSPVSSIRSHDGRIDMAESIPDNASPPIPPVTISNQVASPVALSLTSSQEMWKKLYE
ncbi:hypothetical protein FRC02_005558, partial [Tulasnella sp. 418]